MNVKLVLIVAMRMQTVLILMVATLVPAHLDTLEMAYLATVYICAKKCGLLHALPPTDIDECEAGTDGCHDNADCTNTDGSYTCSCSPGYSGDGTSCNG